jgi:hypothetical protein
MPLLPNGQSCLENIGLTHRPILLMKNEYQHTENEYSSNHQNAIADGDGRGRGTQHGGHTHTAPDCAKAEYIGEHFQSPIDAQIDSDLHSGPNGTGGGDCIDVNGRPNLAHSGRVGLLSLNNYNALQEIVYGPEYVITEQNVNDGQYVVGLRPKMNIVCNNAT